jgi:hypothetical protein
MAVLLDEMKKGLTHNYATMTVSRNKGLGLVPELNRHQGKKVLCDQGLAAL